MNDDDFFVSYLGKGGNNMYIETEKKNQKNETVNSILNSSNKKSSTSYNTSFQQIKEKPKIKFNFNNENLPTKTSRLSVKFDNLSNEKEKDKNSYDKFLKEFKRIGTAT